MEGVMLDAFIIEELKKAELAREAERPRLEIPAYIPFSVYIEPKEQIKETIITFEI